LGADWNRREGKKMNLTSKMTLYDMLAMVIPGFLLLKLFPGCFGYPIDFDNEKNTVIIIIISYAIGIIYHKTIEWLFNIIGFRNNEECIEKSAEKFYDNYEKNGGNTQNSLSHYNKHEYYKAYYTLMKENMLNSIPTLEAQVVFIKNMLPLTVVSIALCCGNNCFNINPYCAAIILLIIGVLIIVLMVIILIEVPYEIYYLVSIVGEFIIVRCCWSNNCCINSFCAAIILLTIGAILLIVIQNKIYYLVWEGYEYLIKEPENEN
jgi:hypothetical protein